MPTILGQKRGQRGTFKTSDGQLVYSFSVAYWIKADSPTQTQGEILTTEGLPQVNLTVMYDAGIPTLCKGKSAEQSTSNALRWTVTCDFDNEPTKQNENQGQGETTQGSDPTTWVPVAEITTEDLEEAAYTDASGNAIANSAGTPFDQPIAKYTTIGVLEFIQYETANQNAYDILDRNNIVNGSTFLTKGAKTWLCKVRRAELGYKNGVRVWVVNYQLKYKKDDWTDKRLDIGPVYKVSTDLKKFRDKDQNVIPLGNLTSTGGDNGTTARIKSFDIYGTNAFTFLRIS